MRIYIVDDDRFIRQGLQATIMRNLENVEIVGEAADGQSAIADIAELLPDVVITDIKMPILDGVQLVALIVGLGKGIKTIVLSGYDDYAYVRQSMKNGAMDYLLKPIEPKQLFSLLKLIQYHSDGVALSTISTLPELVDNARTYIHKHYAEKLSLQVVADYVHLNSSYFSELFKTHIGKPFGAHLAEVRINHAKELLINTQYKSYEICEMVGYEEVVSFNRAFKRITGASPGDFKKSYYNNGVK